MKDMTKRSVSTKADENSEAVVTQVTFDWSGVTTEEVQQLAEQALTVKVQSSWRRNGIPTGDVTVKVAEHKPGTRNVSAKDPMAAVSALLPKLTPEQRDEVKKRLAAK